MKRKSSKAESKDQSEKYSALIQQLQSLEIQWKSFKDSVSSRNYTHTRSPSSHTLTNLTSFDHSLLENSPRSLMSSLQRRNSSSPSPLSLKINSSDLAVEELLYDRRAAIVSGKLKGRRLFRASEEEGSDGGGEISSDWLNMDGEREVIIISENHDQLSDGFDESCSFSDNSRAGEKVDEAAVEGGDVGVKRGGDVVGMAWFGFVLILVTLGLISMSCNGKFVQESELILVPT